MGKKIKYRKGVNYFLSHSKHTDYDEKYDTPEKEIEWEQLVAQKQAEFQLPQPNNEPGQTIEQQIEAKVLQMIKDGILKEGPNYND